MDERWDETTEEANRRAHIRALAAIAAFPHNLARSAGLEAKEDARRERAVADSIRDADALLAGLARKVGP